MAKHTVTLIPGDGIGPEVTNAARRIIEAVGCPIEWEIREAGAQAFKKGLATGLPIETIESIKKNRVALKGPLETPIGYGEKSANVTIRKFFETYGNIRPVRELPGVPGPYKGRGVDIVIVRENMEDLYAGIEYMQTPSVAQCLKLISKKGSEKIIRLAFEVAKAEGRKKVHCATKANIMKLTEGLFKRTFEAVSKDYPEIEAKHIIIDNCLHQLIKDPTQFDVIVTTNMNGDIASDASSALVGGLGFAPGANIGDDFAIFEAVHGSAPKYAGKNLINPLAVILSSLMMLRHLGEFQAVETIEHAIWCTMDYDQCLTQDCVGSQLAASTTTFTETIIKNLGRRHESFHSRNYKPISLPRSIFSKHDPCTITRTIEGVDIFIESTAAPDELGKKLDLLCANTPWRLKLISCRGGQVYPEVGGQTKNLVNHFQCRFVSKNSDNLTDHNILTLLQIIGTSYQWMHVEKCMVFDDQEGFTKAHGEH